MSKHKTLAYILLCLLPFFLAIGRAVADIATGIIVIIFLINSWHFKKWEWIGNIEIKLGLVLWIYLVLISGLNIKENSYAIIEAIFWLRFILLFASMRWLLEDQGSLRRLMGVILVIIVTIAFDAYDQYITGTSIIGNPLEGDRLTGILSHPNVGNLIVKLMFPVIGVMFYLIILRKKAYEIIIATILIAVIFALIPLTGERSITVLFLGGLITSIFFIVFFVSKLRRYALIFSVIAVCLAWGIVTTQPVVEKRARYFINQTQNFSETVYGQLFKSAYLLWQKSPVIGIGFRQFKNECPLLMSKGQVKYCDIHPHNIYLEWLSETGIIGLSIFLLFIFYITKRVYKNMRGAENMNLLIHASVLSALVVLLFPIIVTQSHFSNWPALLFWYSLGLAFNTSRLANSVH